MDNEPNSHWADAVAEDINQGLFRKAISRLLGQTVGAAVKALGALDLGLMWGGGSDPEAWSASLIAIRKAADTALSTAEVNGAEHIEILSGATYVLRRAQELLDVLGDAGPEDATPDQRSRLLVAGWLMGEASAGLSFVTTGTLQAAHLRVLDSNRRAANLSRGNETRAHTQRRWQAPLLRFAEAFLQKDSTATNADVLSAYMATGPQGFPGSNGPSTALTKWRREGKLPQRP